MNPDQHDGSYELVRETVGAYADCSLDELDYMLGDDAISLEMDEKHLAEIISAYLRTLSKRHRYIFMSRYYMAESIEKIASDLSVSKSTVNKDIAIIKEGLKNALEKEGYRV